ncbi:MAG: hypothetical protein HC929_09850 [Leptolyngbyaceae cyanobacterium SM2_5_2]|nr:hypothetical protein [Leptolyngbyaceae cyanobacterium SM2_5_2]
MKKVCLVKNWDYKLDLFRQTPGSQGLWNGYEFSFDTNEKFDYLIVFNRTRKNIQISVPPENIWAVIQEPPNEVFKPLHRGQKEFRRVYCQDTNLNSKKYFMAPPALPWFVNKTYDQLRNTEIPEKIKNVSCISSKNIWFSGHRRRLEIIQELQKQMDFDLFGWGFKSISDKWDALAPYKYSIVLENHQGPYYWSEKLADCLLSFTLPIYVGCTNIYEYFPEGSILSLDVNSPHLIDEIKSAVESDLWSNKLSLILEARKLILEKYQFFPFIVNEMKKHEELISIPSSISMKEKVKISSRSLASIEMLTRSKISTLKNNLVRY